MNTVDPTTIKEFQIHKLYATGQSYVSALEDETKYCDIKGVEEVMKHLKNTMKGFKNELTGTYKRWEYLSIHWSRDMYEILTENDINSFNALFKNRNTIEISERKGKYFEIYVTRKSNDVFDVVVKTYTYIGLTESSIHFLDEEQGKLMLARKLYLLKKNE